MLCFELVFDMSDCCEMGVVVWETMVEWSYSKCFLSIRTLKFDWGEAGCFDREFSITIPVFTVANALLDVSFVAKLFRNLCWSSFWLNLMVGADDESDWKFEIEIVDALEIAVDNGVSLSFVLPALSRLMY